MARGIRFCRTRFSHGRRFFDSRNVQKCVTQIIYLGPLPTVRLMCVCVCVRARATRQVEMDQPLFEEEIKWRRGRRQGKRQQQRPLYNQHWQCNCVGSCRDVGATQAAATAFAAAQAGSAEEVPGATAAAAAGAEDCAVVVVATAAAEAGALARSAAEAGASAFGALGLGTWRDGCGGRSRGRCSRG